MKASVFLKICFIGVWLCFSNLSFCYAYERIISLAPSVTESLYLLGLKYKILAVTIYCPKSYNIDKIGTTLEPNIEQIVYLKPDLVLACKEANSRRTVEKLENLGINVFVIEESKNFSDICNNFIILGKLVDRETKARDIVKQAKSELEALYRKISKFAPKKVFWEIGARPLITINKESFVDEIIKFSGGINIFSQVNAKYPRISYEEVIKRDPEVIIMITMGDVSNEEFVRWEKFSQIHAVKNDRLYVVDASLVCWPIPSNFVKSVKVISKLLHPE